MSDRPRVWVDGFVFENDHQRGIWRVFYEIMRRTADKVDYTLWLRSPARRPLPPGVKVVQDAGRRIGAIWNPIGHARRFGSQLWIPSDLRKADVFHSSFFTLCPVKGPVVIVSVYDMIVERYFGIFGEWVVRHIAEKATAIEAATACVAISHETATDVRRFFGNKERVTVVHLGSEHLSGSSVASAGSGSYALYVGDRWSYKNFGVVLDAMARPEWPQSLQLRVAGPAFKPHEESLLRALGLLGRVQHNGRVSDDELQALYRGASCLIFPSLLEGFGLPVLEAQSNCCPVVLSDTPVFREVAGDAGQFFNPHHAEKLAEAVAEVSKPSLRTQLIETGLVNVSRFSWDKAAEQMVEVYHEAARMRSNTGES